MSVSADPVPAIIESEAVGEVRDVFDDIKLTTGVGVVNLIWRCLAVTHGALPAVWNMLRPLYTTGLLTVEAKCFRENVILPKLPKLSQPVLLAAGIDALGQKTIGTILESYNRTNLINLISLRAGLARLNNVVEYNEIKVEKVEEVPLDPLPPLPVMSVLDPHIRMLIENLNSICEEDGTIIASMYRHLAYWPGYLSLIKILLDPVAENGQVQSIINAVRDDTSSQGMRIATHLKPIDPTLNEVVLSDIQTVLTLFTEHPLSKMVVICGMLLEAMTQRENAVNKVN